MTRLFALISGRQGVQVGHITVTLTTLWELLKLHGDVRALTGLELPSNQKWNSQRMEDVSPGISHVF